MERERSPKSWSFLDASRKALEAEKKRKASSTEEKSATERRPESPVSGADNLIETEPDIKECLRPHRSR